MAVRHFTMDEVVHFIMIFWAIELIVMIKLCFGRRGVLRLTQTMTMVVTVTVQKKVLEQ